MKHLSLPYPPRFRKGEISATIPAFPAHSPRGRLGFPESPSPAEGDFVTRATGNFSQQYWRWAEPTTLQADEGSFSVAYKGETGMERSLILLKPDAVQRRLIGRIISRFEDKALTIVAMKLMQVTPELSKQHYVEHVEKPFYPALESFITGAPVVAMVLEGLDAIRVVREMLGKTSGLQAAAGTIRGDFSSSRQMNLVHASDGPDAAKREISLYFSDEELVGYEPCLTPWFRAEDE